MGWLMCKRQQSRVKKDETFLHDVSHFSIGLQSSYKSAARRQHSLRYFTVLYSA